MPTLSLSSSDRRHRPGAGGNWLRWTPAYDPQSAGIGPRL